MKDMESPRTTPSLVLTERAPSDSPGIPESETDRAPCTSAVHEIVMKSFGEDQSWQRSVGEASL